VLIPIHFLDIIFRGKAILFYEEFGRIRNSQAAVPTFDKADYQLSRWKNKVMTI
jgi:hypothetical protein